jgi:hypothetical protein
MIGAAAATLYLVQDWTTGPGDAVSFPAIMALVDDAAIADEMPDVHPSYAHPEDVPPEVANEPEAIEIPAAEVSTPPGAAPRRGPSRSEVSNAGAARREVAPPGRVIFRFFPADCDVFLNDRPLHPAGNLVDMELPPGRYVLRIQSPTGSRRRVEEFEIVSGMPRALGTLELDTRPETTAAGPSVPTAPAEVESDGIEEAQ